MARFIRPGKLFLLYQVRLVAFYTRWGRHVDTARVVCGDLVDDILPAAQFDSATAIGSTLREIGVAVRSAAIASLARLVAPRGQLLVHGDHDTVDPAAGALAGAGQRVVELRVDDQVSPGAVLVRAAR